MEQQELLESINHLSLIDAEATVESLRQGTASSRNVESLSVGRERFLRSVRRDLDFVAQGGSKVRFLCAPWGGGKTHFLLLVKADISDRRLLSSFVELNAREAPFDKFEVIFSKMMRSIACPDGRGLDSLFLEWARNFPYYTSSEIETRLGEISPSIDFRAALRACLQYANTDSPDHRMMLLAVISWLQGNPVTSELSRATGIRSKITIANVNEILGSFLEFIRASGYSGLAVLLDEAEAITSLSQSRRRDEANQNIRKLLDNADDHHGLYVLMSTTPQFLDDPVKGAKSYPALWSRIGDVGSGTAVGMSSHSPVMMLPALDRDALMTLGTLIVAVHSRAYGWKGSEYCDRQSLEGYTSLFLEQPDSRKVRAFVRGLVQILDLAEEGGDVTPFAGQQPSFDLDS